LFADESFFVALDWLNNDLLVTLLQNEAFDVSENVERSIERSEDGAFGPREGHRVALELFNLDF
jgi:hypothetical protein